jgi:hypothetical protein
MLQIKRGQMAWRLLVYIGFCGEVPIQLLQKLEGYYDYNRRLVTGLVREGFLRERRLLGYQRRVIRSLSLTEKAFAVIWHQEPNLAGELRRHLMAPADGQGDWKKTLRLHRGAACLLLATKLGAVWRPGKMKASSLHQKLVYYSAYEINRLYGRDNKGARTAGVLFSHWRYFPVYYLGKHNLLWSEESEAMFRSQLEASPIGGSFVYGGDFLIGEGWDLVENLVVHAVNPRTRLIRFSNRECFYYAAFDDNGLAQLRLLLDSDRQAALRSLLYREQICEDYGCSDYLFSLERVAEFYSPPGGRPRPLGSAEGYFFDFQMPVMELICTPGTALHPIPSRFLEMMDQEGGGEDGSVR